MKAPHYWWCMITQSIVFLEIRKYTITAYSRSHNYITCTCEWKHLNQWNQLLTAIHPDCSKVQWSPCVDQTQIQLRGRRAPYIASHSSDQYLSYHAALSWCFDSCICFLNTTYRCNCSHINNAINKAILKKNKQQLSVQDIMLCIYRNPLSVKAFSVWARLRREHQIWPLEDLIAVMMNVYLLKGLWNLEAILFGDIGIKQTNKQTKRIDWLILSSAVVLALLPCALVIKKKKN